MREPVPAIADIAGRLNSTAARAFEAAGVIDSKFGAATLLRLTGDSEGKDSCLSFLKRIDQPNLRISGWSCQGRPYRPGGANRVTGSDNPRLRGAF